MKTNSYNDSHILRLVLQVSHNSKLFPFITETELFN